LAGRNEIVSPTTITKALVKETQGQGEAPSAESPGGALEHTATEEVLCPFLETAEGWSIEYSGGSCQVYILWFGVVGGLVGHGRLVAKMLR
jgi:hypothetical protein